MDFVGTLTLRHETLLAAIVETLESVAAHGFSNLVIFNSHGGNLGIARVALEQFGADHPQCRVVLATWWQLAAAELMPLNESGPGGVGHACEFETSLVLLAAPDLVDAAAIQARQNLPTFPWAEADLLRGPRASIFRTMKEVSPNGAQGEPSAASRAKGEAITRVVLAALEQLILDLFGSEEKDNGVIGDG
jgi:creatinine amidohydrolase